MAPERHGPPRLSTTSEDRTRAEGGDSTDAIDDPAPTLPRIANFRDLGGHPAAGGLRVRPGLVYRSTVLAGLGPDDAARLWGLGIRTVYDLRTEEERSRQPEAERLPRGVEYVVADVAGGAGAESPMWLLAHLDRPDEVREALRDGRAESTFAARFRRFVTAASARAAYATVFGGLADRSRLPAIIHCSTGKDRTGWAAAALLTLLGVPTDVVERDFLASTGELRAMMAPLVDRYVTAGGEAADIAPLVGVMPSYLDGALDEVRRSYGSVEGYVADGLGLGAAAPDRLRANLLEPA